MIAVLLALASAIAFGGSDYTAGMACCISASGTPRSARLPAPGSRAATAATGVMGVAGAMTFFVASHKGLLAVTAVVTSLYPAGTILLARILLSERLNRIRLAGLCLAGAAVALIAVAGPAEAGRVRYASRMPDAVIPRSHRDLLESPIPVTLATVGPTGHPQVTAIWAIPEGDSIVTSLAGVRQKLKNLVAHPRATVFVIDPANPYRTLEVRGDVTIDPDPELETLQKVLAAYGTDLASFPGPLEDRTTVTLHPTRVVALG
jgi:PPOX class probable F420-dependent enzyme